MQVISKKQMNLIFLKAIIKLKLNNILLNSHNFKKLSLELLDVHGFVSNDLTHHVNNITKSQFNSFNDRANKIISKYKFSDSNQLSIDLTCFKEIKPIISNNYIKKEVINILSELRKMIQ